MSHFCVLVVGDNWEQQLKPFNECQTEDNGQYFKFNDITDELTEELETGTCQMMVNKDGTRLSPWDKRFKNPRYDWGRSSDEKEWVYPAGWKEITVPFKERYATLSEFAKDWHGYEAEENGRYGYMSNKDAKWDWYQMGGRYHGRLKLSVEGSGWGIKGTDAYANDFLLGEKPPERPADRVDQAMVKDIDWEGMRLARIQERTEYWAEYEADLAKAQNDGDRSWAAMKYGIEKGQTREKYIDGAEKFSCFAVVKDGKWYEKGKMGWWAIVTDEKDQDRWQVELQQLLTGLDPSTMLTIVDCHI